MPNMDGMDLLQAIRNSDSDHLRQLPVIIVTGAEDDDGTKSTALAAGASDFITKPFDAVQLLARIRAQTEVQQKSRDLKETAATLEHHTTIDAVTGLANARSFHDQGTQAVAYAIRHRTDLALIVLEADQQETLANVEEHREPGAAIARQIARILRRNIRCEDIAARLDGYRFALLSPGANAIGARRLARRVCAEIAGWHVPSVAPVRKITLSAGIVTPNIQRDTRLDDLIKQADERLLAARSSGGNQVIYKEGGDLAPPPLDIPTLSDLAPPSRDVRASPTEVEPSHIAPPLSDWMPSATPTLQPATEAPLPSEPDLNRAMQLLKSGLVERLEPHLRTLVRECLPLLDHWNRTQKLQLESELDRIRQACREPELEVRPFSPEANSLL
jgi:diguanylate cyclase (GGDEF)-like protein